MMQKMWVRARDLRDGDCWLHDINQTSIAPVHLEAIGDDQIRVSWAPHSEYDRAVFGPDAALLIMRDADG